MEKEVAFVIVLAPLLAADPFTYGYPPLTFLLKPSTSDHLRTELHVLTEVKCFAHFIQVSPDVWTVREEGWPVRIECEIEHIGMAWDIASSSRVSILEPGSTDVVVLLIDLKVHVHCMLLHLVGTEYARQPGTYAYYSHSAAVRIV